MDSFFPFPFREVRSWAECKLNLLAGVQCTFPSPLLGRSCWLGWAGCWLGCLVASESLLRGGKACLCGLLCTSCGGWEQAKGLCLHRKARAWPRQLCLRRYNSLSILPAALGKPVRDVALKVGDGQRWVRPGAGVGAVGFSLGLTWTCLLPSRPKLLASTGTCLGTCCRVGGYWWLPKVGWGRDIRGQCLVAWGAKVTSAGGEVLLNLVVCSDPLLLK